MTDHDVINTTNKKNKKPFYRHNKFNNNFNRNKEIASRALATKEDLIKLKEFFDKKYNHD